MTDDNFFQISMFRKKERYMIFKKILKIILILYLLHYFFDFRKSMAQHYFYILARCMVLVLYLNLVILTFRCYKRKKFYHLSLKKLILQNLLPLPMIEISKISLSSSLNQQKNPPLFDYKYQKSTEGGQSSCRGSESKSTSSKASALNNQILKIQQAQNQMERKFQKCIESLIKQIEQKEALNNKLFKEVSDLKQNIEQSKKDIQVISSYVKKNIQTKNNPQNKQIKKISLTNVEIIGSVRSLKKPFEENSPKKASTKLFGSK